MVPSSISAQTNRSPLCGGSGGVLLLCGASYNPGEIRERYLALCEEETGSLAAACPILTAEEVEIELRNVFRRLFEEKDIAVSAAQVEDTALLFRVLSFCALLAPNLMEGAKR